MKNQKVHTLELTTEDIIHLVSAVANKNKDDNTKDLEDAIETSFALLRLNNLTKVVKDMLDSNFDAYSTFVKLLKILKEEDNKFAPVTEKRYLCVYRFAKNNPNPYTSRTYPSREEMKMCVGDSAEIIQEFEIDLEIFPE